MNRDIGIEMELPFFKVRYQFTVYKKEEASGMDFMLLKMVNLAHSLDASEVSLAQLMDVFAVHRDLLPLITKMFRKLTELKLVKTPYNIDENTDVKKFVITESGEKVLEDYIIGESEKTVEKTLYCFPGKTDRYDIDSPPTVTNKPAKIQFDKGYEEEGVEFATANPNLIYKGKGEIVSHFVLETPLASNYLQKIKLTFDGETGKFVINEDYGLDVKFVRNRYSGDALIRRIPEGIFEISQEYKTKTWSDTIPSEVSDYMLPSDLELKKSTVFCNAGSFIRTSSESHKLPEDYGCDVVIVESRLKGFKCWFVETNDVFDRMETEQKVKLVAYRNMSRDEIDAIMKDI